MQVSRLHLEHYNLTKVVVVPRVDADTVPLGSYPSFMDAEFGSAVELHEDVFTAEGQRRYGVELHLTAKPNEGRKFPYEFELGVFGVFDAEQLPEEKRAALALVNGASMLYGVLRELLLSLTSRCIQGPVMLPTVQFSDLAVQREERLAREMADQTMSSQSSPAN